MSQAINNAATQAVESGFYAAEGTKQEATGAAQTASAVTGNVKREAQVKASDIQTAASDAAGTAQEKFPETAAQTTSTTDMLQNRLAEKTNAAASEGQADIEAAKATGNSYIDQAKFVGGSVLATAQGYVEAGQNKLAEQARSENGGIVPTLAGAANTALGVTKSALSSAQETLQPHIDNAKATAQPHIENAKSAAQPYFDSVKTTAQPYVQSASEKAGPYVQSATDTVKPYVQSTAESAKPYVQAARETVVSKTSESTSSSDSTAVV